MNKQEFSNIYQSYFDDIRRYLYYRSADKEIAGDIAQDTFVKLWEKSINYEPSKNIGLLYKIAGNLWVDYCRKQKNQLKYELHFDMNFEFTEAKDKIDYQTIKITYEKALASLPEKQRIVFLMHRADELSYKEIAERLKISVKTVEKRMSVVLKLLKTRLNY